MEPSHGYIRQQRQSRSKNKEKQVPNPSAIMVVKPAPIELTASKILWELKRKESVALKHRAK